MYNYDQEVKFEFEVLLNSISVVPASAYTGNTDGKRVLYALKVPIVPRADMIGKSSEFSHENLNFHNLVALIAGKDELWGNRWYEGDTHDKIELDTRCDIPHVVVPVYEDVEYRMPVYTCGQYFYKMDTLRENISPQFTVAAIGTVTGTFAPSPSGTPTLSDVSVTGLRKFRWDGLFSGGCGPFYIDKTPCQSGDWEHTTPEFHWYMLLNSQHFSYCSLEQIEHLQNVTDCMWSCMALDAVMPLYIIEYTDHDYPDHCDDCVDKPDKLQLNHTHADRTDGVHVVDDSEGQFYTAWDS